MGSCSTPAQRLSSTGDPECVRHRILALLLELYPEEHRRMCTKNQTPQGSLKPGSQDQRGVAVAACHGQFLYGVNESAEESMLW
jgi:hypothetical protein